MKTKFLNHIKTMNSFYGISHIIGNAGFIPFEIDNQQVGFIHKHNRKFLPKDLFICAEDCIRLTPNLTTPQDRTNALLSVCEKLHKREIIPKWHGEFYSIRKSFTGTELAQIERESTKFFGITNYGVHLNGIVIKSDGTSHMWIATRAFHKSRHPGKLDNLVAGGCGAGDSPKKTLLKECLEEANMNESILQKATSGGFVSYISIRPGNLLLRDCIFVYDIILPEDFVPRVNDGNIDHFELLPIEEVKRIVEETDNFKPNCNLVVIDWMVRNGFIPPEDDDYIEICKGLRFF